MGIYVPDILKAFAWKWHACKNEWKPLSEGNHNLIDDSQNFFWTFRKLTAMKWTFLFYHLVLLWSNVFPHQRPWQPCPPFMIWYKLGYQLGYDISVYRDQSRSVITTNTIRCTKVPMPMIKCSLGLFSYKKNYMITFYVSTHIHVKRFCRNLE